MGLFDFVMEPISLKGVRKEDLAGNLQKASNYLAIMEEVVDEKHKIADYRNKINKTVEVLQLPGTVVKDLKTALKIAKAVSDISKIHYLHAQPEKAARAFGQLFAGVGKLAHYLPPPVSSYLEIFADAENFFLSFRKNVGHMKERIDRHGLHDELNMDNPSW